MNLPTITSYGKYNSDNYGVNSLKVEFDNLTLYFSYKTVVALTFRDLGGLLMQPIVRQNDWSTTTGKHLNWIDNGNKKNRLPSEQFENLLNDKLIELGLNINPDDYPE